ncbi:MAG: helix-hairpin-helix domain-containing protein [Oscillospiraceae bacterium]|jgi:competence ComEA-like helix-hairpin-helix protein|nr:helix-hairpin-helix domain-containing protein [Oscillospiraceae bacterium]
MRLKKTEKLVLMIAAAFLLLSVGYFIGSRPVGSSFTIKTEKDAGAAALALAEQESLNTEKKPDDASLPQPAKADDASPEPSPAETRDPTGSDKQEASAGVSPDKDGEEGEGGGEASVTPDNSGGMDKATELPPEPVSKLININTADKSSLCTLPSIGEVKAAAIIEYRERHGGFKSKSDILQVKGIGQATYEKLKELICIVNTD